MRKNLFAVLIIIGSINICSATTPNLEQELYEEKQDNQLQDNYIQSAILAKKAVRIGKETLQSLKSNLAFIQRLESDPKFVKCVVHKANLTKLNELAKGAKRLLDKGKVIQQDYNQYILELNGQKSDLKQKISSNCSN